LLQRRLRRSIPLLSSLLRSAPRYAALLPRCCRHHCRLWSTPTDRRSRSIVLLPNRWAELRVSSITYGIILGITNFPPRFLLFSFLVSNGNVMSIIGCFDIFSYLFSSLVRQGGLITDGSRSDLCTPTCVCVCVWCVCVWCVWCVCVCVCVYFLYARARVRESERSSSSFLSHISHLCIMECIVKYMIGVFVILSSHTGSFSDFVFRHFIVLHFKKTFFSLEINFYV